MKKQINKKLFVLLALIIISITAIGSVSASDDSQGSHLNELDSSNSLDDSLTDDAISDNSYDHEDDESDSDDYEDNSDEDDESDSDDYENDVDEDDESDSNVNEDEDDNSDDDLDDNDELDDENDSDDDLDDDDELDDENDSDDDLDDDDELDDENDSDDESDDDDWDDDLEDYLDEDYLAYQDLVMRYHQLMENHQDVYSKLIPYIINLINYNGNLSNINFTDIFKEKNISNVEEPSDNDLSDDELPDEGLSDDELPDEGLSDDELPDGELSDETHTVENPQEDSVVEEISFENATQKLLELIDESMSSSNENLALKLTGLVKDICNILNSTENFTADFKTYLENEIALENSTGENSEYLDFLTFIYDLINYAENHTDENFTLLDFYETISKGFDMFLTSSSYGGSIPETDINDSNHPIAFDMEINDKLNQNILNGSNSHNDTSEDSLTENVSTQSINPLNLMVLLLILLIVIVGVKIKRDNN